MLPMVRRGILHLGAILALLAGACRLAPAGGDRAISERVIDEKLRRVGLALVSEEEAWIPASERGRCLPCRVLPEAENPALPPHPAGYLLVGVAGEPEEIESVRRAIAAWEPGETIELKVRRNPHRSRESEWWERRVRMILPRAADG